MIQKATLAVFLALFPFTHGCDIFPPSSEYPLDVVIKPDGIAILSTDLGKLYTSDDQGDTWEPLFFFDQIASSVSGNIDELMIATDGTIWGLYTPPSGRRFLTLAARNSISVSCDDGASFESPGGSEANGYFGYEYDQLFVQQPGSPPLVLLDGHLHEVADDARCPFEFQELGFPPPPGYGSYATVCGGTIYQSAGYRLFRSNDRGQTWELEWEFDRGAMALFCKANDPWAVDLYDGEVFKRNESLEWFSVGSFYLGRFWDIFFRNGLLFAIGHDETNQIRILAMAGDGDVQEFPVPEFGDNEYSFDFEIAPDGVFWITTNRAVYRDDVTETWTKVWP